MCTLLQMLYACEANQCVQFNNDSVISNIDTLKITHQHTKVRGADSASGQSQWDFTIGRYKLGLVESQTDVESCAVSDMEMELGITLEVDVLAGLVKSVSKSSGAVFWTKEVRMYMHRYVHTYVHTYIRTYVHTYIHMHIHTFVHTCIHSMHMCVHAYIRM